MQDRERALRAKLATAYRVKARDPQRISALRREIAAEQIRRCIITITASAPPLLDSERQELAALVLKGVAADAAAR